MSMSVRPAIDVAVTVDPSGAVYTAGMTVGGPPSDARSGYWNAYVRKHDANGTEVWTRVFQVAGTPYTGGTAASGLTTDGSGKVVVIGTTGYPEQRGPGLDAFARGFDAAGRELWAHQFGTPDRDGAASVALSADGAVYIVGSTQLVQLNQPMVSEAFIVKMSSAALTSGVSQ